MSITKRGAFFLSSAIFSVGFFHCMINPSAGGTGTGNGVVGKLYQSGGNKPTQGAVVIMRSSDYLPDIQRLFKRNDNDTPFVRQTVTDDSGYYRFDSIPTGMYCIEGRDSGNNCVLIDSVAVDSLSIDTLSDTLKAPAAIRGTIPVVGDNVKVYVRVYGLDVSVEADAEGAFLLDKLPEGNLRLLVSTIRNNEKADTAVKVDITAGSVITIDTLVAPLYSITYEGNGNTSGTVPVDAGRYKTGDTIMVPGNTGNLVNTGYDFAGWNTRKDASGAEYKPGERIVITLGNVTLFASWKYSPPVSAQCGELAGSAYASMTLGEILCAGRDSSGVYYMVDKTGSGMRCFISSSDSLYRKKVNGSSIIGEHYYFLTLEDIKLIFENNNGWRDVYLCWQIDMRRCDSLLSSHMSVYPNPKSIDSLAPGWNDVRQYLQSESLNCRPLTPVEAGEIENKPLVNFPATYVSIIARQPEGNYILATQPLFFSEPGEEVVHYGMPGQMKAREVISYSVASDGGSTWIRFIVDSQQWEAVFRVKMDTAGLQIGRSYLKIDSDTIDLERINPTREVMSELGFNCPQEMEFWTIQ